MALHGEQQYEEQQLVLRPLQSGLRKVIFSTNIAEMSVTIDGVRWVVDPGLHKEASFDPIRNVSVVSVVRISKSSAEQRKGRAGRTAPGTCIRLYAETELDFMRDNSVPEVCTQLLWC